MGKPHLENGRKSLVMAKRNAVSSRMEEEKRILLQQIERTPIVQVACEKAGIGRSTYYRWIADDGKFAKDSRDALARGIQSMNDMAESQLLKNVRDGNMSAIAFWLRSRHPAYGNRVEIAGPGERDELTKDQEALVRRVLAKYSK